MDSVDTLWARPGPWSHNSLAPMRSHSKGRPCKCLRPLANSASSFLVSYPAQQRRQWQPTPVFLPGKSHGRRSQEGCSPWGRWGSDTTERLQFHFSLWCIAEGNGNPLQCSCLENPRGGGAWWAAVSGVTQSRTRLKRLSSSSSTLLKGIPLSLVYDI